jgi:hypothetical protein
MMMMMMMMMMIQRMQCIDVSIHSSNGFYLTPKIERIIVLLSASPEGEARLPMPKGMAYKE